MIELRKSPVVFNEEEHRYFLYGKELKGVTSTLIKRLFPDKYKDVDPEVLANAARKGHELHSLIEYHDNYGTKPEEHGDPRIASYERLKKEHGLTTVANEYLVSDEENYASSIDIVMLNAGGEICLVDIKTTWTLDRQSTAVQLSIYKRFFERQNPGLQVAHIYVLWLPNKDMTIAELHELPVKDDEFIDNLIEADLTDQPFDIVATYGSLPEAVRSVENEIVMIEKELKEYKEREEELKKGLYKVMEENDIKSFRGTRITLTRVLPTTAETLDQRALKKECPDIYARFTKKTNKAGSLRITITDK